MNNVQQLEPRKTYSVHAICNNCWHRFDAVIPNKVLVSKHESTCPVCECLHAAFHILELSAIRPTADNHEPLAYLQEFLIRQIGLRVW